MTKERGELPIARACALAAVSRGGFYRRLGGPPRDETALQDEIEQIVFDYPSYGYRLVTRELRRRSRTTQSDHGQPVFPNLLPGCEISGLDQVWVADVTYIRLERPFVFLAVIVDRYSRRVIGWELSDRLDVGLTLGARNRALAWRTVRPQLVHHSDRGIPYAARDYVAAA